MDFKNSAIIVAIATVVIAVLMLATGRDDVDAIESTKHEVFEHIASESTQEANDEIEAMPLSVETTVEIIAPESLLDKYSGAEQITENSQSTAEQLNATEKNLLAGDISQPKYKQAQQSTEGKQPIWLDQSLGNFKSIDKGPVMFNILPTSPDGLQGTNPKQVVTKKSDRFVSFGIPADYNYQRMPMYNGGYYIAPMPSYLMPSMLPKSLEVETK